MLLYLSGSSVWISVILAKNISIAEFLSYYQFLGVLSMDETRSAVLFFFEEK
jgi:hypothetical protein